MLAFTVLLGSQLRYWLPDLDIPDLRQKLNRLVLTIFLPALTFKVIYGADIGGAFWQVAIGLLIGIPVAVGAGRLMATQLFGVKPGDPFMLALATLLLSVVALLASAIPAWRAAGVEPTRFRESSGLGSRPSGHSRYGSGTSRPHPPVGSRRIQRQHLYRTRRL